MKKIVTLIFVAILGFVLMHGIYSINSFDNMTNADLNDRVSSKYITSSVNSDAPETEYGKTSDLESSSANVVTRIVVDYRSFDTLGEVTVLFISALGVGYLLSSGTRRSYGYKANGVLKTASAVLFPIIVTIGVNIFVHGHLTPGGGFPGGAMIASAVLLILLSGGRVGLKSKKFKITEGLAGTSYAVIGLIGLVAAGSFLKNWLPTGVVGDLLSAGIIPLVSIAIGIKVGMELSGLIADFFAKEAA